MDWKSIFWYDIRSRADRHFAGSVEMLPRPPQRIASQQRVSSSASSSVRFEAYAFVRNTCENRIARTVVGLALQWKD